MAWRAHEQTRRTTQVNIPSIQKIMVNFQVENERAEMTQEVMGDMLDDAMAEDGDSDEEEKIVGAVLDEIGISFGDTIPGRAGRDGGAAAGGAGRSSRGGRWRGRRRPAAAAERRRHDGVRPRGAAEQPAEVEAFFNIVPPFCATARSRRRRILGEARTPSTSVSHTPKTLLPPSRPFPPPLVLRLGGDARALDGVDEPFRAVLERLRLVQRFLGRRLALQTKARVLRGLVRADPIRNEHRPLNNGLLALLVVRVRRRVGAGEHVSAICRLASRAAARNRWPSRAAV